MWSRSVNYRTLKSQALLTLETIYEQLSRKGVNKCSTPTSASGMIIEATVSHVRAALITETFGCHRASAVYPETRTVTRIVFPLATHSLTSISQSRRCPARFS